MLIDLLNLVGIRCNGPTRQAQDSNRGHSMPGGSQASPPNSLPTRFVKAGDQVADFLTSSNGLHRARFQASKCRTQTSEDVNGLSSASILPPSRKHLGRHGYQLVYRLQEESCRSGGWIRLLPNATVWKYYACLYPSGRACQSVGAFVDDNHFGPASSVESLFPGDRKTCKKVSYSELRESDRVASFVASWLDSITANLKNRTPSGGTHLTCRNTSSISINLQSYLKSLPRKSDVTFCTTAVNSASTGPSEPFYTPMHCMTPNYLIESLSGRHGHQVRAQLLTCYSNTLSHLPFFLRQLGHPPHALPGICPLTKCSHSEWDGSCGLIHSGVARPHVDGPLRSGQVKACGDFGVNSAHTSSNSIGRMLLILIEKYRPFIRPEGDEESPPNRHRLSVDRLASIGEQLGPFVVAKVFAIYLSHVYRGPSTESRPGCHSSVLTVQIQHEYDYLRKFAGQIALKQLIHDLRVHRSPEIFDQQLNVLMKRFAQETGSILFSQLSQLECDYYENQITDNFKLSALSENLDELHLGIILSVYACKYLGSSSRTTLDSSEKALAGVNRSHLPPNDNEKFETGCKPSIDHLLPSELSRRHSTPSESSTRRSISHSKTSTWKYWPSALFLRLYKFFGRTSHQRQAVTQSPRHSRHLVTQFTPPHDEE